jgi:hypothetical protein
LYIEAGCGPDESHETAAAEYASGFADLCGAGRETAGGSVARGRGMAVGPIPGPITLVSCLFAVGSIPDTVSKKRKENVQAKTFCTMNRIRNI